MREFFLAHPCAAEKMYAEKDLIHIPTAEFHLICAPGEEFMMVKAHADDPVEMRMAHRVGEVVPTKDGRGSVISRVDVNLRHFRSVEELRTTEAVADAMFADRPILGRTKFLGDDAQTEVICEYPVTVMNAMTDKKCWQVDTGPVLVPDFSLRPALEVGLFRQAYLVYNSWDWAELAMRHPTERSKPGCLVMHYSDPKRLTVRNQLFAAEVES